MSETAKHLSECSTPGDLVFGADGLTVVEEARRLHADDSPRAKAIRRSLEEDSAQVAHLQAGGAPILPDGEPDHAALTELLTRPSAIRPSLEEWEQAGRELVRARDRIEGRADSNATWVGWDTAIDVLCTLVRRLPIGVP